MMKRFGVLALAVLALAACDRPQSSTSGGSGGGDSGVSSEKYARDRDNCRAQVAEYMRGRRNVEDSRRDVLRGDDERYGRSTMTTQMADYGDTKTNDQAMANCMEGRGWPAARGSWWSRIGQPHTF